jgi:hypothetical protein
MKCGPVDYTERASASAQWSGRGDVCHGVDETARPRVRHVIGPDGSRLTLADLPLSHTGRWVIRRKAEVVAAVRGGLLSLDEACSRYCLNSDEFLSWQRCIDRFGLAGLRSTRTQFYLSGVTKQERPAQARCGSG